MAPASTDPTRANHGADAATRADAVAARDAARERRRSALFLSAALVVWAFTTFAHGLGTDLAYTYYQWAKSDGALRAGGGRSGVAAGEAILAAAFFALVAVGTWTAFRRLRGLDAHERRDRLVVWAVWGAVVHLLWHCCIVFATEFVHFAQYGIVGALLCAAFRRRRPEAAFLVATGLGVLDEAWQHWGIAYWIEDVRWHGFDWSDLILNAAGACGGVLAVGRDAAAPRPDGVPARTVLRTAAVLAAILLPLRLFVDRVTLTALFGSYAYHPTWNEYDIGKSVHWLTPIDGMPLFVASVLVLGLLATGVRTFVSGGPALALLLLCTAAIDRPSRLDGRPLHEVVPAADAHRAAGPVRVDGVLDEPDWARAERIGPFELNLAEGQSPPPGVDATHPPAPTFARLLWDERALYIAFEVEDRDVWGRATARDDPRLPGDEVVEVFVDPDGDEATYYEFEVSPLGVVYDLFNVIPASPTDFNPTAPFLGFAHWDAHEVETAVVVHGTADRVPDWEPVGPLDEDRGWTVEIAIPWTVFRTTTTPSEHGRVQLPPVAGDRWRLGLYRVERPRASPIDGRVLGRNDAKPFAQLQAWSPTRRGSFHRPERFGVVEFMDPR